eukprot:6479698-Amphidinium_carterae.1
MEDDSIAMSSQETQDANYLFYVTPGELYTPPKTSLSSTQQVFTRQCNADNGMQLPVTPCCACGLELLLKLSSKLKSKLKSLLP